MTGMPARKPVYIYNVHFKGRSHCLVYDNSKEFARFLSCQKQSVSNAFHFMISVYSSKTARDLFQRFGLSLSSTCRKKTVCITRTLPYNNLPPDKGNTANLQFFAFAAKFLPTYFTTWTNMQKMGSFEFYRTAIFWELTAHSPPS